MYTQACQGWGRARKYVKVVQHPVLGAERYFAHKEDEFSQLDIVTDHEAHAQSVDTIQNTSQNPLPHTGRSRTGTRRQGWRW